MGATPIDFLFPGPNATSTLSRRKQFPSSPNMHLFFSSSPKAHADAGELLTGLTRSFLSISP